MENPLTHIALIPDGNRRWAKQNNMPVYKGHERGYEKVREFLALAKKHGIQFVTVWAFSTENWNRKEEEVVGLMDIITKGLSKIHEDARKEKTKVVHIGRRDRLGGKLLTLLETVEKETSMYTEFCLCIALDYGGSDEFIRAGKEMILEIDSNKDICDYLDTAKVALPPIDLVVRTGGEKRTSGFMPLQSSYAEWVFEEKFLPDFDEVVFNKIIEEYNSRKRRFGK